MIESGKTGKRQNILHSKLGVVPSANETDKKGHEKRDFIVFGVSSNDIQPRGVRDLDALAKLKIDKMTTILGLLNHVMLNSNAVGSMRI
ncbi:hypothetical protein G9A89_020312 [Geosiphon pyriformis]|nr:hypothetical protein G9A89_020312 [Geosiphon pyriformis]